MTRKTIVHFLCEEGKNEKKTIRNLTRTLYVLARLVFEIVFEYVRACLSGFFQVLCAP